MDRHLPPLNALRAFEAAGRNGSFSRAAEELNVTHAAVSRHVRGLEHQLGVQLFRNISRGVELTDVGIAYLAQIKPAFDKISRATEAISKPLSTKVHISCEPTFATRWLMPRLGNFQDRHPDIEIKLDATGKIANLQQYECDIGIRFCHYLPVDLPNDEVCKSPVYPYGHPSIAELKTPADLLKLRLLHEDHGELWRAWFAEVGLESVVFNHKANPLRLSLAIEGALAGNGVMLAPAELLKKDIDQGNLKCLWDVALPYGDYRIVYLSEVIRRKPVRIFRDWLLKETSSLRRKRS